MASVPPYKESLEGLGVEVITRDATYEWAGDYIRANGHMFGTFYFIRVDVVEQLLEVARRASPDARVIFHAPDLYYLRESRMAELSGDPEERRIAEETKAREAAVMRAVDHVVLVSPAELPYVHALVPKERVSIFPALYSAVTEQPAGYAARKNILFLGGFGHRPNVGAVVWFVEQVWPLIHQALPDVEFHIVGAGVPDSVRQLDEHGGVRVIGFVEDLGPLLAAYRVNVAPLLYGAGIKGKVGAALGAGIPSVVTTIASEGMHIVDGVHALVRDEPADFAAAVVSLYQDANLWTRISASGQKLIEDNFSSKANQAAFSRVLDNAHALPLELYIKHCQRAVPEPISNPGEAETVDVSIIIPAHNQWELTRACLNSVIRAVRATGIVTEIILADDGSIDDTAEAENHYRGLRVVRQNKNLGFLLNSKVAASTARGRYLLFLNNDTIVLPNWLMALFEAMESDSTIAIAGSKLLYPDGTIQEAGAVLFSDLSAGNLGRGCARHDDKFCFDREVDYVTGASMLVRRTFWDQVGGFDERYVPAYCEDSDLALSARAAGMRVLYAAGSEVVHFEHRSYGQHATVSPKSRASANEVKLLDKWRSEAAHWYLPPSTPPLVAAAHAERNPPASALRRRRAGKLNVLYFSPFPSHPNNHGNQATIQSFGRRFQNMGHKVHFVVLESNLTDDKSIESMRSSWDSLDVLPNRKPLWAAGHEVEFDGWYDEGLGEQIRILVDRYEIDLVICSYVFHSKLLEFVPSHVFKVIDTHDKMGGRYEMLRKNGQPLEFFSCTPSDEGAYLRRADIVVARRQEEARYFNEVAGRNLAIVVPHVEEPHFLDRRFDRLKKAGMVASANRINLAIAVEWLREIERKTERRRVPFEVHIAGQVKDMISGLAAEEAALFSRPWVRLHGFVPNIEDFYKSVDVVVAPVTMGTGINVKTVQAMAYGMPLVATTCATKGIETGHPLHSFETVGPLVSALFELVDQPSRIAELAQVSRERYMSFFVDSVEAIDQLFSAAAQSPEEPVSAAG
jgi:GT2 family glycosyltransferase/glycosyltransferase involved in cell wall biosynthesis